ncbi:MAG TPA: PfkB family carbohydrate kinase [Pirellulales bacterium]|jgi:rfaE bifunctional protein kinase chain/domain|nr:PfkB family carbohydrate kinase [Pirellulales bacterium]
MNAARFAAITERFAGLRIGVAGDFCLDRYLEIDPARSETSLETGLAAHNVVRVRAQPGGAGTIVNNLAALGVGRIELLGFCGDDGEGYELRRALAALPGVRLEHFLTTPLRRTFVYAKPLVIEPGQPPRELNRLDSKNWTPTPVELQRDLAERLRKLADRADALVLLDQVDVAETGVVTASFCDAAHAAQTTHRDLLVLADSRRGLGSFPPLGFKMNAAELGRFSHPPSDISGADLDRIKQAAAALADSTERPVFVTLAERGIVGAIKGRPAEHAAAFPLRGPIDVVGAGDAVTAALAASLAAGAELREAMELAMAAASLVVHQLGTTGTATVEEMDRLLKFSAN